MVWWGVLNAFSRRATFSKAKTFDRVLRASSSIGMIQIWSFGEVVLTVHWKEFCENELYKSKVGKVKSLGN